MLELAGNAARVAYAAATATTAARYLSRSKRPSGASIRRFLRRRSTTPTVLRRRGLHVRRRGAALRRSRLRDARRHETTMLAATADAIQGAVDRVAFKALPSQENALD